jgi:hypothetical protein
MGSLNQVTIMGNVTRDIELQEAETGILSQVKPVPNDRRFIDITGMKFARLTAIGFCEKIGDKNLWAFQCDCGRVVKHRASPVKRGEIKSCGCLKLKPIAIGAVFERWTVLSECGRSEQGHRLLRCRCECGAERVVLGASLTSGRSNSCSCRKIANTTTHGMTGSREIQCWRNMISRCYYEKSSEFPSYGGRGITVCDRWRESFENFYSDMGAKPSRLHSIDRIDNDGSYEPENCRWATLAEQNTNKRSNRKITAFGVTKCLVEWSRQTGLPSQSIIHRIDIQHLSPEEALTRKRKGT